MRGGDCPYLRVERTARRLQGLSFDHPRPVEVSEVWYCRHPFHGVEVALGSDRDAARAACGACTLLAEAGEQPSEGGGAD